PLEVHERSGVGRLGADRTRRSWGQRERREPEGDQRRWEERRRCRQQSGREHTETQAAKFTPVRSPDREDGNECRAGPQEPREAPSSPASPQARRRGWRPGGGGARRARSKITPATTKSPAAAPRIADAQGLSTAGRLNSARKLFHTDHQNRSKSGAPLVIAEVS